MNGLRVGILVAALGIALCGGILTAAAVQPPLYPVPGLIVLLAFVGNTVFAALQTQLNGWKDATPERQALLRLAQNRLDEGHDPIDMLSRPRAVAVDCPGCGARPGHRHEPDCPVRVELAALLKREMADAIERHPQEGGDVVA